MTPIYEYRTTTAHADSDDPRRPWVTVAHSHTGHRWQRRFTPHGLDVFRRRMRQ